VAEPRSGDDLAQLLMEKAAGDETILLRLIDEDDIPDDGLGFHAQQAVEKMIKAVLAHNLITYERTHNIAYLLSCWMTPVQQTKAWTEAQLKGLYDESPAPIAQLDRATPS